MYIIYYKCMFSNHCLHYVYRRHTFQLIIHSGFIFNCNFQETLPFQAWYCNSPTELQLSLEDINQLSVKTHVHPRPQVFLNNKRKFYHIYIYDHRQNMKKILLCIYQLNEKSFFFFFHPTWSPKRFPLSPNTLNSHFISGL